VFHPRILTVNSLYPGKLATAGYLLPILLTIACSVTLAAENWRTGEDFFAALKSKVSINVEQSPIRDSLGRLAASQAVALFVDRRVDPTNELTLAIAQQPLEDAVREIARHKQLGVGFVGPVIYVGPPKTAARIATLAVVKNEEAEKLPANLRNKLLARQLLTWPRLAEPRWIVRKLCAEAGLTLPAADVIPHDLWIAGDYPEMTLAERLTLVLAGFGMTYVVDEKEMQLKLKWMPQAIAVERVYPTRVDANRIIPALSKDYPQAFMRGEGNELWVRSTIEDQWAIESYLSPGKRPRRSSGGQQVYSLAVKDRPLGPVVEQIAEKLNLQVEFGTGANRLRDVRISFAVTNVTLEELFQAAVGPAKLTATVEGKVVRIE
jgi:hypothetical protein